MKKNTLTTIWHKWRGYPIWTMDIDGEVRKSRMRPLGGGLVIVKKVWQWTIANEDGTATHSYIRKWWPR